MAGLAAGGEAGAGGLIAAGHDVLKTVPDFAVDYLTVVDSETLEPIDPIAPGPIGARALIAGRLGQIRLIDNLPLRLGR
jgi:pantothenate synthetase